MQLKITGLDSKGFGKARDEKGRVYKILGALPNETVTVNIITKNRKNIYAVVNEVVQASPYREEPKDPDTFVSSSVWQILNYDQEQKVKADIFKKEFESKIEFFSDAEKELIRNINVAAQPEATSWFYRNKAEIGFYIHDEDESITFAFHMQGCSKKKLPFTESSIFDSRINQVGLKFLDFIKTDKIPFKILKYLVLRSDSQGVVARLCVKDEILDFDLNIFEKLLDDTLKGLQIAYSLPQSPTAVCTKLLYQVGNCDLIEKVADMEFEYGFDHFFQVNKEIFEIAIADMRNLVKEMFKDRSDLTLVDLFAGVGSIGQLLSKGFKKVVAVELSEGTREYALKSAVKNGIENFEFYESDVDKALDKISGANVLVIDPPRAGLTADTVTAIKNNLPEYIIYLSCNHETFVNNLAELSDLYEIKFLKGYNFFPHTPHIECLAVLHRKWDKKLL